MSVLVQAPMTGIIRLARAAQGRANRCEFGVQNAGEVRDDENQRADDEAEENDILRHRRASLVFPQFVGEFPNLRHDTTPLVNVFDDECV